ncbi:hypothetical protein [Rhabdaerophilum calidifontis]|uniref:hypothetical protein n=1 Tax=Rhabdaerophilum calidifontis TaxID=2604328 RepID=UPI00123C7069|nr:hypothetical protein [Rhabdaerophilum calidifontis]
MASLTFSNALLPLAGTDGAETAPAARKGFWARIGEAMIESRRRRAEREIARLEIAYGLRLRETASESDIAARDLPFNR